MGLCCCCFKSRHNPVLPTPLGNDATEYEEFLRLCAEEVGNDNTHGWQIKKDWPQKYKNNFKMRVSLRPHESGNPNNLLRGDGKYIGVQPQHFLEFLLNPENLPGLVEWVDVEDLPDGYIKYCRVKAPCMKARDHVWKYTIDKRDDGSIFVTIRTCRHEKFPVREDAIRAYYYNSCLFQMSKDEDNFMEMTEFIFQDLKGSIPPSLMNSALPAGTIATNKKEMEYLTKKYKI